MHPAQLPSRYVATYLFYREGLETAAARLRAYVAGGDSGYLDEPATAAALAALRTTRTGMRRRRPVRESTPSSA